MKCCTLFEQIKNIFIARPQSAEKNQEEVQRLIDERSITLSESTQKLTIKTNELLQANTQMLNQIHNTNNKNHEY